MPGVGRLVMRLARGRPGIKPSERCSDRDVASCLRIDTERERCDWIPRGERVSRRPSFAGCREGISGAVRLSARLDAAKLRTAIVELRSSEIADSETAEQSVSHLVATFDSQLWRVVHAKRSGRNVTSSEAPPSLDPRSVHARHVHRCPVGCTDRRANKASSGSGKSGCSHSDRRHRDGGEAVGVLVQAFEVDKPAVGSQESHRHGRVQGNQSGDDPSFLQGLFGPGDVGQGADVCGQGHEGAQARAGGNAHGHVQEARNV